MQHNKITSQLLDMFLNYLKMSIKCLKINNRNILIRLYSYRLKYSDINTFVNYKLYSIYSILLYYQYSLTRGHSMD